jgi:hypothetical protein
MTIESITQHILKLVTYDKNVILFKPIAEEEIDKSSWRCLMERPQVEIAS